MTGDFGSATTMSKNETFLKAVFGPHDWERAHVCAVAGDPSHKGKGWFGGHAHLMLVDLKDHTNNYFCVSLFTGTRRRENAFQKLVCLAVDDIGPKLDASLVELLLGVPTWIIETSQGNFQWGYVLETPITDAGVASDLIHRVRVALTGEDAKDPGQENVTRYMRLPTGKNLKESLGDPWDIRIIKLDPGQKLSNKVLDLVPGLVPGQRDKGPGGADGVGGAGGTSISSSTSSLKIGVHAADTLLAAMRKLGLVLGGPRETAMGWGFDILCPWVDEHTDRAETGTVYVAGAGKFRCQHGHCADRTVEDVRDKIDKMLKEAGEPGGLIYEEFDDVDPATVPEPPQGLDDTPPVVKEFFERYVWLSGTNTFFDLVMDCEVTGAEIDALWTKRLLPYLPKVS